MDPHKPRTSSTTFHERYYRLYGVEVIGYTPKRQAISPSNLLHISARKIPHKFTKRLEEEEDLVTLPSITATREKAYLVSNTATREKVYLLSITAAQEKAHLLSITVAPEKTFLLSIVATRFRSSYSQSSRRGPRLICPLPS